MCGHESDTGVTPGAKGSVSVGASLPWDTGNGGNLGPLSGLCKDWSFEMLSYLTLKRG